MKKTMEIDLDASTETWEAFLRRVEEVSAEMADEKPARGVSRGAEAFWENGGVRIDPTAFFALFTGLD